MKIRNSTLTRTENLSSIYRVSYTAFKTSLESYLKKYYKVNNVNIVSTSVGKNNEPSNKCKVILTIDGKTYSLDNCTLADNQLTIYPMYMNCLGVADWVTLIETYPTIEEAFWKAIELNSKIINTENLDIIQNRINATQKEINFLSSPTLIQKRLKQLKEEKAKCSTELENELANCDEFNCLPIE